MSIDQDIFAGFDLNLIVVFMVLYRERSVSRTAELLGLGQPAVSGSLSRLRRRFDDPLFLRIKLGIRPTEKAVKIHSELTPAVLGIESVLSHLTGSAQATQRA